VASQPPIPASEPLQSADAELAASQAPEKAKLETLTLAEILTCNANVADFLADTKLNEIGQKVTRDVEIDEESRKDWLDRYRKWMAMAMQVREAKNFPWPKASNVKFPLLTTAAIQFQARAYPAIVDGSNLVKGRVLGPDPDGSKRDRADRIGAHMTWQLLYKMPGWEEETDRLLLMLPIAGCVFRKTYYDSIGNTNCSEMVSGEDFIINYWAKSLDSAPRYTHRLRFYPHEVKEKIAAELWRDIHVEADAEHGDDADAIVEFYEQHRFLDLDGDGYPEPYVVTTTKDGQVARLVPCFTPQDVKVATSAGIIDLPDAGQTPILRIVCIERRKYFTKYAFIPAPDGSFYDIGFGWLLEDIAEPINVSINQMLDAGTLQNAGGGFLGSGINIRGGSMPFRIGEWKRVEITNNSPLSDNIFRLDHPGPSPVLFQLLGQMVEASKDITAVQNVMTGEGTANQPATTTMALIEQGMKVMTAIFKRIHRSFGEELRNLFALNRDYLDDEENFLINDGEQAQKVAQQDYTDTDLDVVPVSDPSIVTDIQKLARSEAEWTSFNGDPLVNQLELRRRRMEALGVDNIGAMLTVPPMPPDPKLVLAKMEQARKLIEATAKVSQTAALGAMQAADAALACFQAGSIGDAAVLAQVATELGQAAALTIGELNNGDSGQGSVPALAGQPANGGVPSAAPQAPPAIGGSMGAGAPAGSGAASDGGAVGAAGGGQL
jgi:chaperonin GroES